MNWANWFVYFFTMPWDKTLYVQACLSPNNTTRLQLSLPLGILIVHDGGVIFYEIIVIDGVDNFKTIRNL